MSGKYNKGKRKGSQPVQTKRSSKNQWKWGKQVGYAVRILNSNKYFKAKALC